MEETGVCKSEGYAKLAPLKTAGTEVTLALSVWAQVPTDTHKNSSGIISSCFATAVHMDACLQLSLQQSSHHVPPLTIVHRASVIDRFLF